MLHVYEILAAVTESRTTASSGKIIINRTVDQENRFYTAHG